MSSFNFISQLEDFNKGESQAECEICGNQFNIKDFEIRKVGKNELLVCKECQNKLSNKQIKKESDNDKDLMNLLKTRYVKGEISKKEYEEIKKELED